MLAQFDGLLAGYSAAADAAGLPAMSKLELLWVNLDGDLFDLEVRASHMRAALCVTLQPPAAHCFEQAAASQHNTGRAALKNH